MDKTTLNAQLVTTGLKRVFITSNLLIEKDQICGNVLVWLSMKKNGRLDFAAC